MASVPTPTSSTPTTIPAYLSKKVLVLIVGEEGAGKSELLQALTSLDPRTTSWSTNSNPPLLGASPSTSDPKPFTGVKIHHNGTPHHEGPTWIEFVIVPPRLIPSTRAMLYQGAQGVLGAYHVSDARSYDSCWKRIGHVCDVLGVSVWQPHLPSDHTTLPVMTVAMDRATMSPFRSRMTPFETTLSTPTSPDTFHAFFDQVCYHPHPPSKASSPSALRSTAPALPSDSVRRKPFKVFVAKPPRGPFS